MNDESINIPAFHQFSSRWLTKASRYRGQNLSHAFDRFFTLFVVYNRAYDEAARFVLATNPEIFNPWSKLKPRRPLLVTNLGDKLKATQGIMKFCGPSLRSNVFSDVTVLNALEELESLVADHRFYFFFDRDTGAPQPDRDLLALRNARAGTVIGALELLYQLRCNLFHGQKAFEQQQLSVLLPANVILDAVVRHVVEQVILRATAIRNECNFQREPSPQCLYD